MANAIVPSRTTRLYCSGASRKRTLGCVGVGLLVAIPSLSSVVVVVEASPVFQHRVGAAHRRVSYPHVVEGRPRDLHSKFHTPTDARPLSVHFEGRERAELVKDDPDHKFWSVVADASHLRQPGSTTTSTGIDENQKQRDDEGSLRHNRRRERVTNKFVEDSTSAILLEDAVPEGIDAEEQDFEFYQIPTNLHENYEGYNVTAEITYNVSSPQDDYVYGTTGGTASSVVTTSSRDNTTSVTNSTYKPLRIRAILSQQQDGGQYLTDRGREVLLHDIIRPALLTWSAALRVEPVVGNLTVDAHQLFDSKTCGPGAESGMPSPKVPAYHLTTGVPDTDTILYLSIGFGRGAFHSETGFIKNTTANGTDFYTDPTIDDGVTWQIGKHFHVNPKTAGDDDELRKEDSFFRWGEHTQAPTTHAEADFAAQQPWRCSGDYVAAASYCSTDQYDRPTAGMLHICIDELFFSEESRSRQIVTIMHEVGHVLGFNSRSMAHFRRPDGSPITPRVAGEVVETLVECTGPSSNRRFANVSLPSEEILQFRTVRGGVRVAEVVSDSVRLVARNHFNCRTLTGAELESLSGDEEEDDCIGDHWERRLFQNDLMNPVVDGVEYQPYISTITLAYFADSGWYQVDLSMAELAASWGRAAGCRFVEDTCIDTDGTVSADNKPFFCNAVPKMTTKGLIQQIDGCTADLYRKATCSLGQYDSELPREYQYFGSMYDGTVGGSDPFIDYCPTYSGFDNGLCSMENSALLKVNNIERFGTKNSRCLSGVVNSNPTALCLPIACVVEDRSLHVKIGRAWRTCQHKDQELKVKDEQFVVCPDPRRVCPTFYCHHDCLGTSGRCDYDTGYCVCDSGQDETDGVRTSGASGCEEEELDGDQNSTLVTMPHANSPLSDIYFLDKESLPGDHDELATPLQSIVLAVFAVIIAIAAFFYLRLQGESETGEGNDSDGPPDQANPDANKDKMIATVLVDMRINAPDPDAASVARTAEGSVFDLSSSTSVNSLPPTSSSLMDQDDRSSLASEEVMDRGDPLASPILASNECSVRKRRLLGRALT